MFICHECGKTFEEPKVYEETHGLDSGPYEKWAVCPHCNNTGYSEAIECSPCGKLIAEDLKQLGNNCEPLCDVCYEDLYYE